MQKKDDKVGNKTTDKKKKRRKKRERERKIEMDSQKRSTFWLLRMREKPKRSLITPGQSENNLFSCKTRFYPFLC